MTEQSWRGNWWLPASETAIAGTLHQLGDGHLRLDLVGRVQPDDDEFMILGQTLDGLHALEINIMLISLVLMAKIGVPAEVQRRAVGSQYLWYIVQEFNRN